MSNVSDKELDRLSREAADSYEPDESSLSWSRLEQKLTREMPDRPPDGFRFGRMNPYVWGPTIVLLAGLSFFFIKYNAHRKYSTLNNQITSQPVSSSATDDKQAGGNTIHPDSVSSSAGLIHPDNKNASTPDHIDASTSGGIDNEKRYAESVSALSSKKISGSAGKNSAANSKSLAGNHHSVHNHSGTGTIIPGTSTVASSMGSSAPAGNAANGNLSDAKERPNATGDAGVVSRNKTSMGLPALIYGGNSMGQISGNDSLMNTLAQSKTPIHSKTLHLNRSLNFGFTFGPDYTNAGGISNNQIGNNIGLTVGYYLTSKLSINTGIIYSNKFYWSKAHYYFLRPPSNISPMAYVRTFAAPPPIDYINGASNIWELPLTLRYDFVHYNKTRFFANAGLSSYFMMNQTYIYFFHSGQNQLALKVTDNQQSNYWFGVADLSIGFEAEVGKGFSFQAEPFLKLPLQNMGMENLKLTSYGFLLTFKYAPVLGRSKK
jgi:hypothetical protein